jgi:undecaprenyl-diphosphatase
VVIALFVAPAVVAAATADNGPSTALSLPLAALLGAIQGATEFLPVSSSGHLALAQRLFSVDAASAGHRFTIAAHAGTLLAVVWVYRTEIQQLFAAAIRPQRASEGRAWIVAIIVATLPLAVALAPGFEDMVVQIESRPRLVGVALLCTAAVLWFAFRQRPPLPDPPIRTAPRLSQAIGIGLAQLIAVAPGISRSGSTIAAGGLLGLDRERAARFSFLISIPAILGATALEVRKALGSDAPVFDVAPYVVGFTTSLLVGFLCLRWLLRIIRGGDMRVFVAYLAVVGTIAIVVM